MFNYVLLSFYLFIAYSHWGLLFSTVMLIARRDRDKDRNAWETPGSQIGNSDYITYCAPEFNVYYCTWYMHTAWCSPALWLTAGWQYSLNSYEKYFRIILFNITNCTKMFVGVGLTVWCSYTTCKDALYDK